MTMSYDIGKIKEYIDKKIYSSTTKGYVLTKGTIGNGHYLAIPDNSSNKEGAMLAIDFMQSPEAQIEKLKLDKWGDLPIFDENKLAEEQLKLFKSIKLGPINVVDLLNSRLPEMKTKFIEYINSIWYSEVYGAKRK